MGTRMNHANYFAIFLLFFICGGMCDTTLWNQRVPNGFTVNILASTETLTCSPDITNVADDFIIPNGQTWTIGTINIDGWENGDGQIISQVLNIYQSLGTDANPGLLRYQTSMNVPSTGSGLVQRTFTLNPPLTLTSGVYWVSTYAVQNLNSPGGSITTDPIFSVILYSVTHTTAEATFYDPSGCYYGIVFNNWLGTSVIFSSTRSLSFDVSGNITTYPILYSQAIKNYYSGFFASDFWGSSVDTYSGTPYTWVELSDDFTVPSNGWVITGFQFFGAFTPDQIQAEPYFSSWFCVIYDGSAGYPGTPLQIFDSVIATTGTDPNPIISTSPLLLSAGVYFISCAAQIDYSTDGISGPQWRVWLDDGPVQGYNFDIIDRTGFLFGSQGFTNMWISGPDAFSGKTNLPFNIFGTVGLTTQPLTSQPLTSQPLTTRALTSSALTSQPITSHFLTTQEMTTSINPCQVLLDNTANFGIGPQFSLDQKPTVVFSTGSTHQLLSYIHLGVNVTMNSTVLASIYDTDTNGKPVGSSLGNSTLIVSTGSSSFVFTFTLSNTPGDIGNKILEPNKKYAISFESTDNFVLISNQTYQARSGYQYLKDYIFSGNDWMLANESIAFSIEGCIFSLTTQPLTSRGLTTQGLTTRELTTQALTTQALTTRELTTQAMTTREMTTHEMTTQEMTTHELTTQELTSQELTTQELTSQEMTSQQLTTQEDLTTQELTTQEMTTQELTTQELTTQELTTQEMTTQELTSQEMTTQEMTTQEMTTQELTTQEMTTQELTTQELTTQEMTTQPLTTKEITTSPSVLVVATVFDCNFGGNEVSDIDFANTIQDVLGAPDIGVIFIEGGKRDFEKIFYFYGANSTSFSSQLVAMLQANSSDLADAGLSLQSFSYSLQTVPVPPSTSTSGSGSTTTTSSATNSVTSSPLVSLTTNSKTENVKESGLNKQDTIAIAVVVPVGFLCLVLLIVVIVYFARKGNYKAESSPNSIEMANKKETPKGDAEASSETSSESSRSSRSSTSVSAAEGTETTETSSASGSNSGSESNSSSSSD